MGGISSCTGIGRLLQVNPHSLVINLAINETWCINQRIPACEETSAAIGGPSSSKRDEGARIDVIHACSFSGPVIDRVLKDTQRVEHHFGTTAGALSSLGDDQTCVSETS